MKKKNGLHLVIITFALVTLIIIGCQKDDHQHSLYQTEVYTFDVTYIGAGQRIASCSSVSVPLYSTNDAVLVYTNTSSSSTCWTPQPYQTTDGYNFWYQVWDGGHFIFYADAGEGYHWVNNFTKQIKIVVIPSWVHTETLSKEIDYSNYDEVVKFFNLVDGM